MRAERAVFPPSRSVAAIPEDAIAKAIPLFDLIEAKVTVIRKVLPVPPGASRLLWYKFRKIVFDVLSQGNNIEVRFARNHKVVDVWCISVGRV